VQVRKVIEAFVVKLCENLLRLWVLLWALARLNRDGCRLCLRPREDLPPPIGIRVRDPSLMRRDARADALVGRDASIHGVPPPLWIGVVCPSRQAAHQLGAQPVALPPPLPKPQQMCVCPPHPKTMIERGWACIGDTMDGFGGQRMMSR
jgi:hypothetical protein